MDDSANAILVVGKSDPPVYAVGVVLATTRLDVNRTVRRRLGMRKASFAPPMRPAELTGMEIGGVTPFALPDGLPLWIDSRVMERERVVVGGGSRPARWSDRRRCCSLSPAPRSSTTSPNRQVRLPRAASTRNTLMSTKRPSRRGRSGDQLEGDGRATAEALGVAGRLALEELAGELLGVVHAERPQVLGVGGQGGDAHRPARP